MLTLLSAHGLCLQYNINHINHASLRHFISFRILDSDLNVLISLFKSNGLNAMFLIALTNNIINDDDNHWDEENDEEKDET